jgi:hypothetical protein
VKFTVRPLTVLVGQDTTGGWFELAADVATGMTPLENSEDPFACWVVWVMSDVQVTTTVMRFASWVPVIPGTSTHVT